MRIKFSSLVTGKLELWRRLLLLFFLALGIWCFMYVSLTSLIKIEFVDFDWEQFYVEYGKPDLPEYQRLAELPLHEFTAEYIDAIPAGSLIELEESQWDNFTLQVKEAYNGRIPSEWNKRLITRDRGRKARSIYFRPDEHPVAMLVSKTDAFDNPVYFKRQITSEEEPLYLRMSLLATSHDDFSLGYGYTYIDEPPPAFFRPLRPYSYLFLLAGLLVYLFLPRPRRSPDTMAYSKGSVISTDFVMVFLFVPFFGLPLFIAAGSHQALVIFLPGTLIFWAISLLSLWPLLYSSWHASFELSLDDEHLVLSDYKGERLIPWSDIAYFKTAEKRYPPWLAILTILSMLSAKNAATRSTAAVHANMAATSVSYGFRIHLHNGSWFDI